MVMASSKCVCVRLTVEGVALFLRSVGARGLAGTLVVELPDELFLPASSVIPVLRFSPCWPTRL